MTKRNIKAFKKLIEALQSEKIFVKNEITRSINSDFCIYIKTDIKRARIFSKIEDKSDLDDEMIKLLISKLIT